MTAALIFRRQLVRSRPLYFKQVLTDKLPLEKFHRLLDLVFWVKFLKLNIVSLFVFFGEFYRVSPGITGYHRVSLDPVFFRLAGLRRSPDAAGGTCHA